MANRLWMIRPGEQPELFDAFSADFGVTGILRPGHVGPIIAASLTEQGVVLPVDVLEQLARTELSTGEMQAIVLYVGHAAGEYDINVASTLATTWNRTILVDEAELGAGVFDRTQNWEEPAGS